MSRSWDSLYAGLVKCPACGHKSLDRCKNWEGCERRACGYERVWGAEEQLAAEKFLREQDILRAEEAEAERDRHDPARWRITDEMVDRAAQAEHDHGQCECGGASMDQHREFARVMLAAAFDVQVSPSATASAPTQRAEPDDRKGPRDE